MILNILLTTSDITFFSQNKNNVEILKKIPLFIYFDKFTDSLHFSENYKAFALENFDNFFDYFVEALQTGKTFNTSKQKLNINDILDKIFEEDLPSFDKIHIIYSNKINPKAQNNFLSYINKRFSVDAKTFNLLETATKYLILSQQISTKSGKIHIVFAEGSDIFVSKNTFHQNNFKTESIVRLETKNFSPFVIALANEILSDLQRLYNQKFTEDEKKSILLLLMLKLKKQEAEIKNKQQKYIVFSTRIPGSKQNFVLRIEKEKLNILQKKVTKNFIDEIKEKLNIGKNDYLGIVGNLNKNLYNLISENFATVVSLEPQKLIVTKEIDVAEAIKENETTFEENKIEADYEKQSSVKLSDIEIGWQIVLKNFDPRPGKGASMQKLEYLGDKIFVVIESTRSLRTGDIAEIKGDEIAVGTKAMFDIKRGGKIYGRFITRQIREIEIKKEKN